MYIFKDDIGLSRPNCFQDITNRKYFQYAQRFKLTNLFNTLNEPRLYTKPTTRRHNSIFPLHTCKGMVLYSAVSSPLDRSKRFTLSSPGRPVHSDTVLGFSWKHASHATIAQRLCTHISTTVYSHHAAQTTIQENNCSVMHNMNESGTGSWRDHGSTRTKGRTSYQQ